jgi:hypothetical protein
MDTKTLEATTLALGQAVNGKPFQDPAWATYRTEKAAAEEQWAEWLHVTHANEFTTGQARVIYEKAWEDGHAFGYSEVEIHYQDLVDLIRRIQAAG